VENTAHWVRDVVFGEDKSQVRTRNTPAVLAAVRDLIRSALKLAGYVNTAAGRRARFTQGPLVTVGESLPSAVIVDVGLIQDPDTGHERWVVVEANIPWLSHSYAARTDIVLGVALRAAGPRGQVSPCDAPSLRASAAPVRI
jgi:hypothetical protein